MEMPPEGKGLKRRQALLGLGAGMMLSAIGCTPATLTPKPHPRVFSRKPWAAPRVQSDGVIRVIVGHRPYRRTGFRVERVRYDNKSVIHNYGHGGGGLSLGWGAAALAVRQAAGIPAGKAAVLGSGVMGLCTARLLQDAGWDVTIYTRDPYRHTTSNVAAGQWSPTSTHSSSAVDDRFLSQLDWAARVAHHAYSNLVGARYGIRWVENLELYSAPRTTGIDLSFADLFPYQGTLNPGEHPFGDWYVRHMVTMQINPGTFLRQIVSDFRAAGGRIEVRTFSDLGSILSLSEDVIFNCTGLGSAALFDDQELEPAKGQLVLLPPDPAVDYMTVGGGDPGVRGFLHMFSRTDAVVLGGYFKRGDSSSHIEHDHTERIVEEHRKLFAEFG